MHPNVCIYLFLCWHFVYINICINITIYINLYKYKDMYVYIHIIIFKQHCSVFWAHISIILHQNGFLGGRLSHANRIERCAGVQFPHLNQKTTAFPHTHACHLLFIAPILVKTPSYQKLHVSSNLLDEYATSI